MAQKSNFRHPCYRINNILSGMIGQWPYQSKRESRFCLAISLGFTLTLFCAQVRKIVVKGSSTEIILEALPPFLVELTCATNLINCLLTSEKLLGLMKHMENDWNEATGPRYKILEDYAYLGRTMILVYSSWLYTSMVAFLCIPFAPKLIVACGFANISAPLGFAVPVDYYIDAEKYYVPLQIHHCTTVTLLVSTIISMDTIFVMLVQHVCGVFAIICYRLENLIESDDLEVELHPDRAFDKDFWTISDCIKQHNEAIEFAETLDAVFSWSFFFQMGIDMAALTFTTCLMFMRMGEGLEEACRQALLTAAEILHLFFECYFSQRVTDHSLEVFESLKKTKWYKTSIRSRRLLNFMIMRSERPCELRAGKVYVMSMQNYSMMLRTSMSYFTILVSMQ